MNVNDRLHGFIVESIRPVPEADGNLCALRHEKTGARLLWMRNKEENKLFSITFKTIPWDDTGVFHILEHSVLGGSKKYPVKEPFLELMKSSMNTFLNAMTFPDKTMFPVSSRNWQDFMNLTEVYLDAVFDPAIYYNPGIFRQEGWHIELRDPADTPLYKGVVFNEMKGALSSVYDRMTLELQRMLYPDNCYGFESGGDPVSIPNLTYERFLAAHREFYHPSNAYIYLDGEMDVAPVLALINSYLSRFEAGVADHPVPAQKSVAPVQRTREYAVAPEEPLENHTYAALGKVLADWSERDRIMALQILSEVLSGSNDAPLKRALLDTGLCRDASLSLQDGVSQPFGTLELMNTEAEHVPELIRTARDTARALVEGGLNREDLEAAINLLEFRFREGEEPRGLTRNINMLASWLYGGDPLLYVNCDGMFKTLRERLDTGYYENLLREWLLDETGTAQITMLPSRDYGERERADEERRLEAIRAGWTEADRDAVIAANRALDDWQQSADTPEQLATMPQLSLSEVSEKPLPMITEESEQGGVKVLKHPSRQKGITAIGLYFSLADMNADEISDMAAMTDLLGELPTRSHDGATLQRLIRALLGDLQFSVQAFGRKGTPDKCRVTLSVQSRFLSHNREEALGLIAEILTQTRFDSPELIRELLLQTDEDARQSIISSGHRIATSRARAVLTADAAVRELVAGFEGYRRQHERVQDLDNRLPGFIAALQDLAGRTFARARLIASVTSEEETPLETLLNALPEGSAPACEEMRFALDVPAAQGILIPAPISYSGYTLPELAKDSAAWNVASSILSLEYLWNEVRVKGGAYGAGAAASLLGEVSFYSYRDPSPARTLETDRGAAAFLRAYCAQKPALDRYIISTIAQGEPLLSDASRGALADTLWMRGVTEAQRAENRRRTLAMTAGDIEGLCDALEKPGTFCVVGAQEALNACEGLEIESI